MVLRPDRKPLRSEAYQSDRKGNLLWKECWAWPRIGLTSSSGAGENINHKKCTPSTLVAGPVSKKDVRGIAFLEGVQQNRVGRRRKDVGATI